MLCPFCGGKSKTLFSGTLPIYLSALPVARSGENKLYPFSVELCLSCGLGFNGNPAPPKTLNDIYDNYLYIDPFHNIGNTHFSHIADMIVGHSDARDKIVEIGSSVGFLLDLLRNRGYNDLTGIDPSPQSDIAISKGLNIYKKYYEASDFIDTVDLFVLRHIFEHFQDPFVVLRNMISRLSNNGKIIIETPNFSGFHHQHLFFYSYLFYTNLANSYGLNIIDYEKYEDNIIVVFAKRLNASQIVKTGAIESVYDLAQKAKLQQDKLNKNVKCARNFLKEHSEIYWWGTGSFSAILLSQLSYDDLRDTPIFPLDSDINRKGFFLANIAQPILYVEDIKGLKPKALVIGSSLKDEIKRAMKIYDIVPEKALEFD
ncbi:MAG: class I SAM-dependent methyltransferase [Helicobacteraceae bacterium]|jgi:2-polyprenyl-3-methyl-5-hydroxy-6-metoxy-1,4-benzoquinol methylase|nr:class I SAM-dependent methyltransferase [Helicobacteraceae bacterium]